MKREDLIQDIVETLARCQRLAQPAAWSELGLSRAQAGVLFVIFHHPDLPVKKIAEFLGVSKSAASQLLEPLVDKRLVSRQADARDRRIMRLVLTPEGISLLKRVDKLKYAGLRSALSSLSGSDLRQMAALHQKMDLNLKRQP